MGKIDPESERQRLHHVYSAMSDLELQEVGQDPTAMTELAFEALQREMAQRGLEWPGRNAYLLAPDVTATAHSENASSDSTRSGITPTNATGLGDPVDAPVVLRAFRDMPEALAARMTLESAGIECSLFDETFIRMDWFCSNALGGIKVVVRESDADEAIKILDENGPDNSETKL